MALLTVFFCSYSMCAPVLLLCKRVAWLFVNEAGVKSFAQLLDATAKWLECLFEFMIMQLSSKCL